MKDTIKITGSSRIEKVIFDDETRDIEITFKGERYTGIIRYLNSTSECSKRISKTENPLGSPSRKESGINTQE